MNIRAVLYIIVGFAILCGPKEIYAQYSTAGIDVEEPKVVEVTEGVQLVISLDKKDWMYTLGERPVFTVQLLENNTAVKNKNVEASYTVGLEKMEPTQRGKVSFRNGIAEIQADPLNEPGFLRCEVRVIFNGTTYRTVATAAFDPAKIEPTTITPIDFDEYWANNLTVSRSIPLNSKLTPISTKTNDAVVVYQAEYEFYNDGVQKFYGVLSMPRKEGKFPAIVRFPGAGWLPLGGDQTNAAEGFITLDIYIHGHPVTRDRSYYVDLQHNTLKAYQYKGIADRDSFYFKNAILGCVRSIDFIYSLPQFDGKRIGGWGSSQGGALSIITSALDNRINYMVALCPAMCDFTGYLHDRAGGWPHLFLRPQLYADKKEQVIETLSYYDVVNFAKRLAVPGFFSWGFNDPTTPPTSIYAAYNFIDAPKKLYLIPDGVHKIYPSQRIKTYEWLKESLMIADEQ